MQMTSLVEQVLGDMEGCGIAPSNFTLSILVKLYGRSQDLDTALRHVETMPAKYGFVANDQVYTCLVAACANCGRMAQAYEVFRKLASPDAKAFTTVINGALQPWPGCRGQRHLHGAAAEAQQSIADPHPEAR